MIWKGYRKYFYGIRRKMILLETLLFGGLLISAYIGVNQIVKADRYETLMEQYFYLNDRLMMSFEQIKDDIDQLTAQFILDEYVQKSLRNEEMKPADIAMMEKSLSFYNKSFLDYYLILDNKGNWYSQREVSMNLKNFPNSVLFQILGEDYSDTKILRTRDVIFGTYEMSFFAVRYIHEMNSVHESGVLILKLNNRILEEIENSITDDRLLYFILDQNEEVCFGRLAGGVEWTPDEKENRSILWDMVMYQYQNPAKHDIARGILSSRHDEETGFTILTYAPRTVSITIIHAIQLVLAILFFVVYLIGISLLIVFTNRLIKPIVSISKEMSIFDESRMEHRITLNTNTELDTIGDAYNRMVEHVRDLMEDVRKKERELRESEQESLMYQIRPHFLYNTLDTIYMLARISKEETIMKMIQSLSRFLRINLSNGKEEIEVKKELEHVAAYLEIQKIRNAELFTYEIEVEPEISEYPVMKMILQPVAENCIKYGFREIYEGGWILIRAWKEEKQILCFSIENNGIPIEEADLKQLNRLEKMPMEQMDAMIKKRQGGYGISNVVKRLRLRYEDRIRFYYVRKENGTECIIKIEMDQEL